MNDRPPVFTSANRGWGPLHIVGLYMLVGALWIIFSDQLAAVVTDEPVRLLTLSTFKGLAFIIVTALLLYWLIRRDMIALQESEARYRSLFQNNHSVMLLIDPASGAIVDANPSACAFYGYTHPEITGLEITAINQLSREQVLAEMERARQEQRRHFFFQHRLAGGEIHPVEVYSGPIEVQGKQLLYSIVHDISERKLAEEQFRLVVETAHIAFLLVNQEHRITLMNGQAEALFGYSREELIGQSVELLIPPHVRDQHHHYRETFFAAPQTQMLGAERNIFGWHKDGHPVPIQVGLTPLATAAGPQVLTTIIDLSERRQAEAALRESEEKYRTLLESLADGVFVAQDYRFIFANPALPAMLGYTHEAFVDLPFEAVIAPEFLPVWTERFSQRIGGGPEPLKHYEVCFLCNGGEQSLWVELRASRIEYQGRPAVMGIISDITERKRTEAELSLSMERLSLALEAARAGTWEWDLKTNENIWSEELWQVYGLESHSCEPSYETWQQTIHPDDRAGAAQVVQEAAANGVELNTEWRVLNPDGTDRWLMSRGKPARDTKGQVVRFNGIVLDITARKQAEEKIRQSEERYRGLFEHMFEGYAYCQMIFADGAAQDWLYITVNEAFEKLTGLKDVTGKRVSEVIPGIREADPELFDIYARVALSGQPEKFELFVQTLAMWFSVSVYSPEKGYFVAVFDVITERKQAEQALQTATRRFQMILSALYGGILVVSNDHRIEFANPSFCHLFDLDDLPEELMGLSAPEMIQKIKNTYADPPLALARIQEIVATGQPLKGEEIAMVGGRTYLRDFIPIMIDGKEYGRLWHHLDITARQQAEAALRQSEENFSKAFKSSPAALLLTRLADGQFIELNDAYCTIVGYERAELIGRRTTDFNIYLDSSQRQAIVDQLRASGSVRGFETSIRHRSGAIRHVVANQEIITFNGELCILSNLLDITARKQAEEKLRASEAKFRAVFDNAPVGISLLDAERNLLESNDMLAQIVRLDEARLVAGAYRARKYIREDGTEIPVSELASTRAIVERRAIHAIVNGIVLEDGETIWTQVSAAPLGLDDPRFVVITQDITERKRAEAKLRESQELFQMLFDLSPVAYALTKLSDKIIDINPACENLFGYSKTEFVGKRVADIDFWADHSERHKAIEKFSSEGRLDDFEFVYKTKSGEMGWAIAYANIIEQSGEKYVLSEFVDITQRKRTEESLRESEARYRLIADNTDDVIWLLSLATGKFTYVSPSVQKLRGYTPEEVLTQTMAEALTPASLAQVAEALPGRLEKFYTGDTTAQVNITEVDQPCKDGSIVQTEVVTTLLTDDQGQVTEILGVTRDITARKQAEAKLRENEEWLRLAYDAAELGIWRNDIAANIYSFDARGREHYGLEVAEMAAAEIIPHIHPDDQARLLQEIAATLDPASSGRFATEYRVVHPNGEVHWLAVQARVVFEGEGAASRPVMGYGTSQDITARKQAEETLRRQAETLREQAELLDHAHVLIRDIDDHILFWNTGMEKLYGWTKEEVLGQVTHTFFQTQFPESLKAFQAELLAQGHWEGELSYIRPDGSRLVVLSHQVVHYDGQGKPTRILEVNNDLTARKQAEEALRESHEKMEALFNVLPVGVSILDQAGHVVYQNSALQTILGLSPERLAQGDYLNRRYLHPDGSPMFPEEFASSRVRRGEAAMVRVETGVIKEDATVVWADVNAVAVPFTDWKIVATTTDITERKQAEAQIQAHARRLQTLADTSRAFAEVGTDYQTVLYLIAQLIGDHLKAGCVIRLLSEDRQWLEAVVVYDQNLAALEATEAVIRSTAYHVVNDAPNPAVRAIHTKQPLLFPAMDPEQLRPFYPPDLWPDLEPYCPRSALIAPLQVQKQALGVLSLSRYRPGQPSFTEDDLRLVQDLADRAALALSNARLFGQVQDELAERKRAEEDLRRTAIELARSNTDLEQFAYVASHDLQEPLRAVAGMLTLLQQRYQGQLDARADEFIGHAVDGATRMQTLINDLLTFSRVGTRGQPFQPVNCADILKVVQANLVIAIQESQASLTHDPLPTVLADRTQLIQLFQNLIANAIKFRGDNTPVIHIGVQQRHETWVFAISDNGIGMEGQYLERIFGVFQRLHTRREYPGTGIGLALCKKIVERHGGRIWVESQPGQGSTFYFTLPNSKGDNNQ